MARDPRELQARQYLRRQVAQTGRSGASRLARVHGPGRPESVCDRNAKNSWTARQQVLFLPGAPPFLTTESVLPTTRSGNL